MNEYCPKCEEIMVQFGADSNDGMLFCANCKEIRMVGSTIPINDPQPAPKPSIGPAIWSLVMRDMAERDVEGATKYGTRLQAGNGRKALIDAYQEVLDLACYLRQEIFEKYGK